MNFEKLQKALELAKASLATKKINKLDDDKLYRNAEKKMQHAKHMNGKNTEQYNWKGEKKINDQIDKVAKEEEPDMASPDKPKGLENKRKPVTHDECGRPFAKEEDDIGGPDKETKSFLDHWEPGTKHPKEPTAGMPPAKTKGQRTTSTGFKMKLVKALADAGHNQSALLYKNWDEMDDIAKAVAEDLEKSNYGPKDMKLYNTTDNIKRKETRTGEEVEGVGRNKGVRNYTTSGSTMQQAHESAENKRQKAKTKASTKVYSDEEKKALMEQYKKEGKI